MRLPEISYDLQTFKGDMFGAIIAAVAGLPLGMAFGVISGLGAIAGLYGAIALGFFAIILGGTRTQVSGPTGTIAIAIAVILATHAEGSLENRLTEVFTIIVMAGVIQILLGALRVGRFVSYTPYSVISGFMSGIGVIIISLQTLPFLGWPAAQGGALVALSTLPEALLNITSSGALSALAIGIVTLAVGVYWPMRLRKYLPPPMAALIIGTLLGVLWLTEAPVIGAVPTGLPTFQLLDLSPNVLLRAVQPALTIALLGSINSLLSSLVADSMTRTRHSPNRELVGQGIGNMAAGFLGGLPGAGIPTGTVANIRAGGRTRVSGVLRAAILLSLVLALGRYVELIPHAVLAGILMKIGWDIIAWRFVTRIHRIQREHLLVMLITLGLTVFVDLVTAVVIGLVAAGMASARQFERMELDSVVSVPMLDRTFFGNRGAGADADDLSARVGLVALRGSFSVASSTNLIHSVSVDIQEHEVVILDFSNTLYMDDSAALVIEQLIDRAIAEKTECIVMGLDGPAAATLEALDALKRVPEDHFVETLDDAREIARGMLERA